MSRYNLFCDGPTPDHTLELPAQELNGEELIELLDAGGFLSHVDGDLDVDVFDCPGGSIGYQVFEADESLVWDVLPDGVSPSDLPQGEDDPGPDDDESDPDDEPPQGGVIDAEEFHEI